MKIIHKDLKAGSIRLLVDSIDDLWQLSQIIEEGDSVRGQTLRKIKAQGSEDSRTAKTTRKPVVLTINIEKVQFSDSTNHLRLLGMITEAPEDIPKGDHHTIDLEPHQQITIIKKGWLQYQLDKLEKATESTGLKKVVLVFDREEAIFVLLTDRGQEILSEHKGNVEKKDQQTTGSTNFYKELSHLLDEYNSRFEPSAIIIASPSFWKEYLQQELSDTVKKKSVLASASQVSTAVIPEIISRKELAATLEEDENAKEAMLVNKVLEAVSKNKACYGLTECQEKCSLGQIEILLVTQNLISKKRKDNEFEVLESTMKHCEKTKGEVHVLSLNQQQVDGLGGIAGVLRWV
ncbi:mRNA surveillance protein pelota [Candidatus Woesearchaeota archaeon]|nr:mRNA surveillance protein pelota [Candidatus Woesearchaeota archaeon]